MAALASAMTGRQPPPRPPKPSSIPSLAQPEGADAVSHHEIEEVASPTLRPRPVIPSTEHLDHDDDTAAQTAWAPTLALKKKENSNSGDDKAIEKHAIEWLNLHLAAKEIQVDNLYTSLKDGLNLIYALEACTGESVGKYNKRAMLPVHKIDNIAVALNFLNKKGIGTQFLSPQDVMNEDRSKILTLFNYILKRF
ncbi:calponin homology domain-containing protein [Chytridium lagenaria]|nr:calponin homology domain-containing protein [Chytridium lagenaria]